jgi:hypothetical protein
MESIHGKERDYVIECWGVVKDLINRRRQNGG